MRDDEGCSVCQGILRKQNEKKIRCILLKYTERNMEENNDSMH